MKGVVSKIVEEALVDPHCVQTRDMLLDMAGVDGTDAPFGNGDDCELARRVAASIVVGHG